MKRNRDDAYLYFEYGLHIPTRTVYLGHDNGVDHAMAERFIKSMHLLESFSSEPITVQSNNIGGDSYHGLAIYDTIKTAASHVTMLVVGHAMSMGSVILQAADERVMCPDAAQMLHYGQLSYDGETQTVYRLASEAKRLDTLMERIYLEKIREKHPSYTIRELRKLLDRDTFLTAQKSVELGLADTVRSPA